MNYHADGQTFKFRLRPAQEFQFQFLFFNTRTQSDCACRGNGQACLDRQVLLVSQTVVEFIQLFLFEVEAQSWVKRHEPNRCAFRPQELVEASSNSTTINLLKLPKMWRLLMRVEKRLIVPSFVPEPTRRNIQHLKDYPVFKVFFFDFQTLAVHDPLDTLAVKGRAAHCDSRTACGIETSKARVPRYKPQKARVPWYQRTSTRTNYYPGQKKRPLRLCIKSEHCSYIYNPDRGQGHGRPFQTTSRMARGRFSARGPYATGLEWPIMPRPRSGL